MPKNFFLITSMGVYVFLTYSVQANVNCADRWGRTPLQDALTGGHSSCCTLLKGKGFIRVCLCICTMCVYAYIYIYTYVCVYINISIVGVHSQCAALEVSRTLLCSRVTV